MVIALVVVNVWALSYKVLIIPRLPFFLPFQASSGSSSHAFENNINFNLDLSASNLEDGRSSIYL